MSDYDPNANFREHYGWVTTPEEGKAAAKTTARRIERSKKRVEISMPGTLEIVSGMVINLADFRPQISGRYKVLVVRQSVSRSAWTTSITCEGAA